MSYCKEKSLCRSTRLHMVSAFFPFLFPSTWFLKLQVPHSSSCSYHHPTKLSWGGLCLLVPVAQPNIWSPSSPVKPPTQKTLSWPLFSLLPSTADPHTVGSQCFVKNPVPPLVQISVYLTGTSLFWWIKYGEAVSHTSGAGWLISQCHNPWGPGDTFVFIPFWKIWRRVGNVVLTVSPPWQNHSPVEVHYITSESHRKERRMF